MRDIIGARSVRALRVAAAVAVVMTLVAGCDSADEPEVQSTTLAPSTTTTTSTTTTSTTIAAPASLSFDPIPGETYYAPFPVAVTLDGDLSDWDGVPRVVMPPPVDGEAPATFVEFAAAADDEFLYLMGKVTDPVIVTGEHGTDYWNEDSVEFYINGTGNRDLVTYTDGVAQITVPPLNAGLGPDEIVLGGVRADTTDAAPVVVETADGYTVEMALPLQSRVWNINRDHGNTIGFQVHLNGSSSAGRDLKVIWSNADTSDSSYQNPSVFGELTFFRIGETSVQIAAPEPTGPPPPPVPDDALYKQADAPISDRVDDLLSRMTLAEKIGQMTLVEKNSITADDVTSLAIGGILSGGGGSPDDNTPEGWAEMVNGFQDAALASRTAVPIIYGVDAVHGHSNVPGAVIFPHNIGLGAANDTELMEAIGRITASEMIATGIYWNYAPAVSVPRDIRWGRTYEGYSEDTDVVSDLAAAYLRGLQGDDLGDAATVLATPKHFVGDGGTAWGSSTTGSYQIDQGVTEVDEETLRAVHLPPYERAIEDGARSIMISYSSWGGEKMHGQQYLITDVLREELGFEGFVVSDWAGIDQITNDYYEAVVRATNAGIDMNMVPYDYRRFIAILTQAVEDGAVSEDRIDEAVGRILTVKLSLGLFERPSGDAALLELVGSDEHRAVAREAVAKSQVLLKNDAGLLPLSADLPYIFVGGEAADDIGIQSGGWTIEWQGNTGEITEGTTILEAMTDTVSSDTEVVFDEFGRFDIPESLESVVCVAVVGERPYAEGFGDDGELRLPVPDLRMLNRMREDCDRLAVILISGRPLIVSDFLGNWDALVAAWLPGTEGQGVADVLLGVQPFTGRTPYTWPRSVEQLPLDPSGGSTDPLFPIGSGLRS